MSPVPVDQGGGGENGGHLGALTHINTLLQLITVCHLLQHLFSLRLKRTTASIIPSKYSQASISFLLGLCTLGALVAYILGIRPLQGDVHFLTLESRTPHPRAQPIIIEGSYNLHQRFYDLALICIYASAAVQLSTVGRNTASKVDRDNTSIGRNNAEGRITRAPEWAVVLIGLAGAVALAAMRSPLLEAFLGGDFDKTRRLSGSSALIAFLLILWRFVAFLDIVSTVYSLHEKEHKDAVSSRICCIIFFQRVQLLPVYSFRVLSGGPCAVAAREFTDGGRAQFRRHLYPFL